jgi:hypothetical protein
MQRRTRGGTITPGVLTASKGTFVVTGQAAGLVYARIMGASVGTFTDTGKAANLLTGRTLTSDVGAFALTGQDAGLIKATPGAFMLTAAQGTFVLTGDAMTPLTDRKLPSDLGTFVLTGQTANLVNSARVLTTAQGSFSLTGQAANLVKSSSTTTWDPANNGTGHTLSNGNLTVTGSGTNAITRSVAGHTSGKYYYEATTTQGSNAILGGCSAAATLNSAYISIDSNSMGVLSNGAVIGGGTTPVGTSFNSGTHVIGVAIDLDNKKFWCRVDGGNWNGSGTDDPATNTGGVALPSGMTSGTIYAAVTLAGSGDNFTANFGGSAYGTTAPSGFGNW